MAFTNQYKPLPFLILALLVSMAPGRAKTTKTRSHAPKRSTPSTRLIPAQLRGQIMFLRGSNVWLVDPIWRRERLIFKNPFWEGPWAPSAMDLAVSPDLKCVVFTHEPKDKTERQFTGNELYIMNIDRTCKKRLTDTVSMDYSVQPRFSPDGKQILYTRRSGYRMGGPGYTGLEIRVVNIDGSNDRLVVGNIGDVGQSHFGGTWSRDGKRILFTHYIGNVDYDGEGDNKRELQTCNLDGTDVKAFDGDYSQFALPSVSPDAKYRAVVEPINPQISSYADLRLFTSQGQFVRELTIGLIDLMKSDPHWGSNNAQVVFQALHVYTAVDKEGFAKQVHTPGIWMIDATGKNLRRIATDATLVAVL